MEDKFQALIVDGLQMSGAMRDYGCDLEAESISCRVENPWIVVWTFHTGVKP